MGKQELCVLFGQTFVHPHLDEYVDEVIFAEPVVISACEFIEQSSSSLSPAVALLGATSPPSFALEVFVQCDGEPRFRRLCQPFLYSHSSSNVLEVEAIVTSHLVVRGSYRSLSLVIYGNTAEDLGQFNVEVDLDSSLTNLVCSTEGKLDDLPPALNSRNQKFEEFVSCPKALSLPGLPGHICIEVKQFLQLIFKVLNLSNHGDVVDKVASTVVSTASFCVTNLRMGMNKPPAKLAIFFEDLKHVLNEARKELDFYQDSLRGSKDAERNYFERGADSVTSAQLIDMINKYLNIKSDSSTIENDPQNESLMLGLSMALLCCCSVEICLEFVNGGGMEQLVRVLQHYTHNSPSITLLLLGVVEQATRHSIGCEGFLGWCPREDNTVPSGSSEGYTLLLKMLLHKQRHDVASLATSVLQRLRLYEVISRYESNVLTLLEDLSADGKVTSICLDMLIHARSQLKNILNLINNRDPVEDPSAIARASRSLIPLQTDGLLSYKSTSSLIASSNCCFSVSDIDAHLLALLQERGFLPLSAALLSSAVLRSEAGHALDIFVDILSLIEAIIFSLLFCRSGLIFLLFHPELCATLIISLRGADNWRNEEAAPLRFAYTLISKGFVCPPREVGTVVEIHLRVVYAIDCLLTSTPNSEEFLWVLWELCGLSRSSCGRQALLSLAHFPEVVSVLLEALHSAKELEPDTINSGVSPINLSIFHSAAEIFEVIVSDSTASSLASWIEHAMELHKALHSSSPGSNRKDAPTRLLEWVDAGAVYHKYGVMGLLRYSAILASGGDAHLSSTSMLVSDSMDVENAVGDSYSGADAHVMENLSKIVSEKLFDGVTLRDASVAQLTTALRILAFISEHPAVAATLYNEGAVTVVYAVLVSCRLMLERSSNTHDYLVDEGTECSSTFDLLLERSREQAMIDLLIPSLVLLNILLQKLQEANEQHKNTKLMNALLRLHQEFSPKLAASASDLSSQYPDSAINFGAVCHLIVSALASWPVYGWSPGLFHSLLSNVQATSFLALGPKETCSLLCIMNDLLPEEGVWLWKKGMPPLSALRTLAVGTILGSRTERQVDWYLQPRQRETLLSQLAPQLEKIAQVILHYAISTLVVVQDMVRVFIVRVACQKSEYASVLVRPILSWICEHLSEPSTLSETDAYKIHTLIDFLAKLLEHPCVKRVLLKEGALKMVAKVLERSVDAAILEANQFPDSINSAKCVFTQLNWCLPVFKLFSLLIDSNKSLQYHDKNDKHSLENANAEDYSSIIAYLFQLCQVLPVGRELLACLVALKETTSCSEGQSSMVAFILRSQSSDLEEAEHGTFDWKRCPFLWCWKKLLKAFDSEDGLSTYAVGSVNAICSAALHFSMDGKSLNVSRISALKYLFGLPSDCIDGSGIDSYLQDNISFIEEMATLLVSKVTEIDHSTTYDTKRSLYQVSERVNSLLILMQKPGSLVHEVDILSTEDTEASFYTDGDVEKLDDYSLLGDFAENFVWECPETLSQSLSVNKLSTVDGQNRRGRTDNAPAELIPQNSFSRSSLPAIVPSGPTRRDNFRHRKPNTSRPPSMHVDDYVARERNVDVNTNSNVIAIQRVPSSSGRPPSIHVDEFNARQRERQNHVPMAVGEMTGQTKNVFAENATSYEKLDKSRPLKTDLDDDLMGIDIVFDGEETDFDDKLPFPQPDDNLQPPPSAAVEQNSPRSIVGETGGDGNESSQFAHVDENAISSSRISASHPTLPLVREPSVTSDKKFQEQSNEPNIPVISTGLDSAARASNPGFLTNYNKSSSTPPQFPTDNRIFQPNFYTNNTVHPSGVVQINTGPQGPYDKKYPIMNNPPLAPMQPPPSSIKPGLSQNTDHAPNQSSPFVNSGDVQQSPVQRRGQYTSAFNNSSIASSMPMPDPKFSRTSQSSPNKSFWPPPPPPSTPYTPGPRSYPPQPMQPLSFGRPTSTPMNMYVGNSPQQMSENSSSNIQHSMPSPAQLQPLQPPQLTRPPQPPLHLRPPNQSTVQSETGMSMLLNSAQMAPQQYQMLQQPQAVFYPPQQQENYPRVLQVPMDQAHAQSSHLQGDNNALSELHDDQALSLQHFFSSPEAIQALLSDRDKLCQVLEQHPKLIPMLQLPLATQQNACYSTDIVHLCDGSVSIRSVVPTMTQLDQSF